MTSSLPETEPRAAELRHGPIPWSRVSLVAGLVAILADLSAVITAAVTIRLEVLAITGAILLLAAVGFAVGWPSRFASRFARNTGRAIVVLMSLTLVWAGAIVSLPGSAQPNAVGKILLLGSAFLVAFFATIATQFDVREFDPRERQMAPFGIGIAATTAFSLAAITFGTGLSFALREEGLTAGTLFAEAVGLALLAATILVGRRMFVALVLVSAGAMVLGFGTAAILDHAEALGIGILILGLHLIITGLIMGSYRSSEESESSPFAFVLGVVFAFSGVAVVCLAAFLVLISAPPAASIGTGGVAVVLGVVGIILIVSGADDPFRYPNGKNPWSPRRYAVVSAVTGIVSPFLIAAVILIAIVGRPGAAVATAGIATGVLLVSVVTAVASIRVRRRTQDRPRRSPRIKVTYVVTAALFVSGPLVVALAVTGIVFLGSTGQPLLLQFALGFVALVVGPALFLIGTPRTVTKVTAGSARVVLGVVVVGYFVLVALLVTDPIDTTIGVWVVMGASLLLVVFDCALIMKLQAGSASRSVGRARLAVILAISITGTVIAGLGAGTTGIAFRFLRDDEVLSAVTLFAAAVGLAWLGVTLLVGRRMVVALAFFATGPLVAGFGIAAMLNEDLGLGLGLLVLGPIAMVTGLVIAYRRPVDVGYLLIIGALVATALSIAVAHESAAEFVIPFACLALALGVTGVLFVTLDPRDPYRQENDVHPWSVWQYAVVALLSLFVAGGSATWAFAVLANGSSGSAVALGGIAVASLALGIPTSVATIRTAAALERFSTELPGPAEAPES